MTKRELMQYRSLCAEISSLTVKLDKLRSKELPVIVGKVIASDREYPYIKHRVSVEMYAPRLKTEYDKTEQLLVDRLAICTRLLTKVMAYINGIDDSELRRIFEMRYIEGASLSDIGEALGMDRSSVGKKITAYINFPTIPILM